MIRHILLTLFLSLMSLTASAQNDPVLAGLIVDYTNKAKKQLATQESAMLLMSTGHIWTKDEVEATYELNKEFNDYLDSFRSIVVYAAQIYGFYHEISNLIDNIGDFNSQFKDAPANALAVALSSKRNKIYRELVMEGIDIVNDIRLVCLSDNKMTEKDRVEIVFNIRPKLKNINKKLKRLTRAVKYTSMSDIWYEIDEGARPKTADKAEIAEKAMRDWRQNGRKIKP